MSTQRNNSDSLPHRLSIAFACVGLTTAIVALIGWALEIRTLTSLGLSGRSFMAPNTALCLALAATAVCLAQRPLRNRYTEIIAKSIGFFIFLFAAATVFEYLSGISLGIDDVFLR